MQLVNRIEPPVLSSPVNDALRENGTNTGKAIQLICCRRVQVEQAALLGRRRASRARASTRSAHRRRATDGPAGTAHAHRDLLAVGELAGKVDRTRVLAGHGTPGGSDRVIDSRARRQPIHAGVGDLSDDVDHDLPNSARRHRRRTGRRCS